MDKVTLGARKIEILNLVKLGYSDKEIGQLLFIESTTIKGHLQRIYEKLGARNRAHVVYLGIKLGLITVDEKNDDMNFRL